MEEGDKLPSILIWLASAPVQDRSPWALLPFHSFLSSVASLLPSICPKV